VVLLLLLVLLPHKMQALSLTLSPRA